MVLPTTINMLRALVLVSSRTESSSTEDYKQSLFYKAVSSSSCHVWNVALMARKTTVSPNSLSAQSTGQNESYLLLMVWPLLAGTERVLSLDHLRKINTWFLRNNCGFATSRNSRNHKLNPYKLGVICNRSMCSTGDISEHICAGVLYI